nr:T9SS type A sorting domain-containing protein [uncultured Mucilaginibacter sp.]
MASRCYAVTVTFTALAGNASTFLQQGNTNQVVFGFQVAVTNGPYSPQVININTTSNGTTSVNTNAMFTGYLANAGSASPSAAIGATQYGSLQFNSGQINITSMPSLATGTYYFYLVLNVSVNTNSGLANQIVFTLPAAGSVAQNVTGVSSVTNLGTNTVYTSGRNFDWTGASSTAWGTQQNWKDANGNSNNVPGQYDCARIGYASTYPRTPTVSSNTSIGQVILGTVSQAANSLAVTSGTLTVGGDITVTSNINNSGTSITISGAGSIAAVNLNVGDNTTPTNNSSFTGLTSSITSLTLSGNINLTANNTTGQRDIDSKFFITGGTVTAANLTTAILNGSSGVQMALTVTNATLNFTGTSPLSSLQTTNAALNSISFNGSGATIGYTGAAQTVYTNSAITGLSGGVTYTNIAFGGSGTKTPNSGTLTVSGTFSTTASTTPTVDFTTNNAILNVTGVTTNVSGATIKQGSGAFTLTGALNNAGTFTGNSGALTANGGTVLTGGTFTTGAGLFSTTSLDNTTGTFQQGSGNVSLTTSMRLFSGTMNFSAGTVGIGTGVAITGGILNGGTGAFTIGNGLSVGPGTLNCGASPGTLSVTGPFSNASTGTFSAGTGTTTFKGAYTNAGTFTYGAGTIIFNNGTTAQALADNSTNGTIFNNVTFSGTGVKTMSGTGQFYVASTGIVTMGTGATLAAGGVLTLRSDANGSAMVDVIPSGASITGNANVQRFFTGGGLSGNRGYRMLSSPVNQTAAAFSNASTYSLSFLKNGVFTGGPGGTGSGFSGTSAGPTLYLYKETRTPSNTTFTSGKHLGISTVNASTLVLSDGSTVTLPVGNGYLFYFVGPASRTSGSSAIAPLDATTTSTGNINQGTFNVNLWYTPTNGAGKLSYTAALAAPGFNMVGNPYPSTIDLNTVLSDNANATTGITAIYELDSRKGGVNQNYVAYTSSGNSSPLVQGYAVSGGGFLVRAASATSVLTFKESQKSTTQLTGSNLIMSAPNAQAITADGKLMGGALTASQKKLMAAQPPTTSDAVTGFYVKMEKDDQVFDYCGVYFKKGYSEKYEGADAVYLTGPTAPVSMSSLSSDGVRTAVNLLPDYHNGSRVKLNVTANTSGLYHLRLEGIRNIDALYDIYLLDRFKKDSLDIRRYGVYDFNLNTADTATFGANRFALSIRRKPLPEYLLANFTASKANEGVKVNWETQNESNYTGFTLEKMNKATAAYEPIYEKQSDGSSTYAFTDRTPNSGNNTYRLKQNDIDSRISYSEPVTIFYDKNAAKGLISVFPNPTVETLNVSIPGQPAATTYLLRLYNSSGNLILQKSSTTNNWSENIGTLKTGAYMVEVIKKDGTSLGKSKFIKN